MYVKNQGTKHEARSPFLVTGEGEKDGHVTVRKVLHSQSNLDVTPALSSDSKSVDTKFLMRRQIRTGPREDLREKRNTQNQTNGHPEAEVWSQIVHHHEADQQELSGDAGLDASSVHVWDPTPTYDDEDWLEACGLGLQGRDFYMGSVDHVVEGDEDLREQEGHEVSGSGDEWPDGAIMLDQFRTPQKGDRILMYNDKSSIWMVVRLTSGMIKYYRVGCTKKTKGVQSFSASILCEGDMYMDVRKQSLGVPQGGSTLKKVDFQVTLISLVLGV